MKRLIILLGTIMALTGCSNTMQQSLEIKENAGPPRIQPAPLAERMLQVPEIDGQKMTVAVYSFLDKTGQRKPADNIANLSSAVTQGAEVWVIKALSEVGNETWFEVVERVGMDNLIKERQLIRNTRQAYEKNLPNGPRELKPMVFAGLILEGGIIGYDSNVAVGGVGARYLGIGTQTEYRVDTVTVVMRIVSVSSGKVLLSIATEKTIASSRSGADIFKFLDMGTKLIESETGYSVNEPTNYAVRAAIEAGIVQLVYEGENKGLWKFKDNIYKGSIPKERPLPMKQALDKWPDSRLYCDKVDLCWPVTNDPKTGKRDNNETKVHE
jgi:curli production assembly/transport component CsgG